MKNIIKKDIPKGISFFSFALFFHIKSGRKHFYGWKEDENEK